MRGINLSYMSEVRPKASFVSHGLNRSWEHNVVRIKKA
jgi:hypothetical protein